MAEEAYPRKINTVTVTGSSDDQAFVDPNGTYPTQTYVDQNQPDVSSLARSGGSAPIEKYGNSKTIYDYPGGKDPTQDNTDRTPVGPPPLSKASRYPYNSVEQSESGHIREVDDTPGAERIFEAHRSGTYMEYRPDGGLVTNIVGKGWVAVADDYSIVVKGSCTVIIAGDADVRVGGDYNLKVQGNYSVQVEGDYREIVGGSRNNEVYGSAVETIAKDNATIIGGDTSLSVAGDAEHQYAGNNSIGVLGDVTMSNKGNYSHNSHGNTSIASTGAYQVAGKSTVAVKSESSLSLDSKSSTSLTSDSQTSVVGSQIHLNSESRSAADVEEPKDVEVPTANNIMDQTSNLRETDYVYGKNFSISEAIANNEDDGPDEQVMKIAKKIGIADSYPADGSIDSISTSSPYVGASYSPTDDKLGNARTDNLNLPTARPEAKEAMSGLSTSLSTKLSPNITLAEMSTGAAVTHHRVKAQAGLSEDEIVHNLSLVAMNILEPLIKHLGGKTFIITSGFRDGKRSKNGKKNSQHNKGQAVDIQFPDKSQIQHVHVAEWIRDNLNYDQCIMEYLSTSPVGGWIHISYSGGSNRGEAFSLFNHKNAQANFSRGSVRGKKINKKTISA